MLVFPGIPEDLAGLSEDDLKDLRDSLVEVIGLATSGKVTLSTAEDNAALREAIDALGSPKEPKEGTVRATYAQKVADREAFAQLLADAAEATAAPEPDEDEDEADDDADDDEQPSVEVDVTVPVSEATEVVEVTAAAKAPALPKKGIGGKATPAARMSGGAPVLALDGIPSKKDGEAFADWTEFSQALQDKAKTVRRDGPRVDVGHVRAEYPAERVLGDSAIFNLGKFDAQWGQGNDEELKAALCAPCTPYYNMTCMNTTVRPVFNSLPQFEAPRGCVSIYPSPSLSDITGGYGFWTPEDDANPAAIKDECQTIACATPTEYFFYGVYRCLTVKNMLDMTFPELVEQYLNRLAAATARMAEVQLLDLMGAAAYTITAPQTGFLASVSVPTQILQFLAAHMERERWDQPEGEMWAPRWLQTMMKVDIMRRRNTSGDSPSVPSDGAINSLFTDIGITPHWYIDTPSWGQGYTAQPKGNSALVDPPTSVRLLLAPRGKFALIDRGDLRIGVTGNVVSRDLTSLRKNEFTYFFESFEGIVNTNTCPADIIRLPVCFNGVQTADDLATCGWLREGAS